MNNITPEEAQKIIQSGEAEVIDVRTSDEFSEGHIPGAKNIDIHNPNFLEIIREFPRNKAYIVVCRSGARSAQACVLMIEAGFGGVVNLDGGTIAWIQAGLPVEK